LSNQTYIVTLHQTISSDRNVNGVFGPISTMGPITVRSRSAHGPITFRSRSAHGPITFRSRSAHGQITFRSRSAHGQEKPLLACTERHLILTGPCLNAIARVKVSVHGAK